MAGLIPSTEKLSSTNITVEKSTAEVYTVRFNDHKSWWIQATIIEARNYVALHTSHGDWSYTWGSPGMPFKKFLTTLDDSYLIGKLGGPRDYFNGDASYMQLKKDVIKHRRGNDVWTDQLTEDEAKEMWHSLKRRFDYSSETNYVCSIHECPSAIIEKIYGDLTNVPFIKEHDPSLQSFVKDLWPGFVKVLADELAQS